MSPLAGYERIIAALGDARRCAAEIEDHEIERQLEDLQTIAIDRLYAAWDHTPSRGVATLDARSAFRQARQTVHRGQPR